MTVATLKMPRLGETMEQGEIVGWLVEVGQNFKRGDAILEVETDKTVVEYPALGDGVLAEILTTEGALVDVGEPIARIDLQGAADWTSNDHTNPEAENTSQSRETSAILDPVTTARAPGERPRATPVARRLARNAGIDLGKLSGTGRRGRIEGHDVTSDAAGDDVQFSHDIAYVSAGPATGARFLMIHGFAGDHTTFSVLASALQRKGCFTVACDLPGHGATRLAAEATADLSQNLARFVRSLFGDTPFHLVAHSMGAIPTLQLAGTAKLLSLTLISPVGMGREADTGFLEGMAAPGSIDRLKSLLDQLSEKPAALSAQALAAVFAEQSRGRLVALANSLGAQSQDSIGNLGRVAQTVPTRVLIGQKDRILTSGGQFDLPPEVAVHSFSNCGHMPHWENPRAVANILLAALRSEG